MRSLRATTSRLAIIEAWNYWARQVQPKVVPIDWATSYFPSSMFYLRTLHDNELVQMSGLGSLRGFWYGVIDSTGQRVIDMDRSPVMLFRRAQAQGLQLVYVH